MSRFNGVNFSRCIGDKIMNILSLSLGKYWTIKESDGYTDLLREFIKHGHKVFVLSPIERREKKKAQLIREENSQILKIKTGNIVKINFIEKGISTLLIEYQFLNAIKKYYSKVHFDLVLYPIPPITCVNVIEYIKKRDGAKTYLLLKDIFPQNAVDIGILSKKGIKGAIYRYFRNKEKKLYYISDTIGCMSPQNVKYVLEHNSYLIPEKVEVCPNVIEVIDKSINMDSRNLIREKYGIPIDKKVFVYGGNLGKPQGIDFLINCLQSRQDDSQAFFLIIGDGTEYNKLEEFKINTKQTNFKLMRRLPKEDYDTVIASCDVGLIFLDHRFTIPNFPSRLLGYMQAKLPVLACTDPNTDIGNIVSEGGFGWRCESNSIKAFNKCIETALNSDTVFLGEKGYQYLMAHYTVEKGYKIIFSKMGENN